MEQDHSLMALWPESIVVAATRLWSALWCDVPDIISAAVGLAIADETGAILVQELGALDALEARGVPFQIRGHTQNVLVLDV
jgi:hypothetical protein